MLTTATHAGKLSCGRLYNRGRRIKSKSWPKTSTRQRARGSLRSTTAAPVVMRRKNGRRLARLSQTGNAGSESLERRATVSAWRCPTHQERRPISRAKRSDFAPRLTISLGPRFYQSPATAPAHEPPRKRWRGSPRRWGSQAVMRCLICASGRWRIGSRSMTGSAVASGV